MKKRSRKRFIAIGFVGLFGIVLLSLLPGHLRPHTGQTDFVENFAAYFVCAALWSVAARRLTEFMFVVGILWACAIVLELVQLSIPGRVADVSDFFANALGALFGAAAVLATQEVSNAFKSPPLN